MTLRKSQVVWHLLLPSDHGNLCGLRYGHMTHDRTLVTCKRCLYVMEKKWRGIAAPTPPVVGRSG